jgi:hypothetical protein
MGIFYLWGIRWGTVSSNFLVCVLDKLYQRNTQLLLDQFSFRITVSLT